MHPKVPERQVVYALAKPAIVTSKYFTFKIIKCLNLMCHKDEKVVPNYFEIACYNFSKTIFLKFV